MTDYAPFIEWGLKIVKDDALPESMIRIGDKLFINTTEGWREVTAKEIAEALRRMDS